MTGLSFNNMAAYYEQLEQFEEALIFAERASNILKTVLVAGNDNLKKVENRVKKIKGRIKENSKQN